MTETNVKYTINGAITGFLVAVIVAILSTTIILTSDVDLINNVTNNTKVVIFSGITLLSFSKSICWIGVHKFSIEQAIYFFIFYILVYFITVFCLTTCKFFGVLLSSGFSNEFGLKEVIAILIVFIVLFLCAIRFKGFCKIVGGIKQPFFK